MIEYTVVMAFDVNELIQKVNEAIVKDWTPLGGISLSKQDGFYMQAMTRELNR